MGCHDEYCRVCGAPFVSFASWNIPKLKRIDTNWLTNAVMEFYSGKRVGVCYYDGYGRFEDDKGVVYNTINETYELQARVYHKACAGRTSSNLSAMEKYHQQEFDIKALVADNNQHLLIEPRS